MVLDCGLAHRDAGGFDQQRASAADQRRNIADGMFYKHGGRPHAAPGLTIPQPLGPSSSGPSGVPYSQPFGQRMHGDGFQGPTTSAEELSALRQTTSQRYPLNVRPTPQMTIHFECRRSNAPRSCDQSLGKHCRSFSEEMTMLREFSLIIQRISKLYSTLSRTYG